MKKVAVKAKAGEYDPGSLVMRAYLKAGTWEKLSKAAGMSIQSLRNYAKSGKDPFQRHVVERLRKFVTPSVSDPAWGNSVFDASTKGRAKKTIAFYWSSATYWLGYAFRNKLSLSDYTDAQAEAFMASLSKDGGSPQLLKRVGSEMRRLRNFIRAQEATKGPARTIAAQGEVEREKFKRPAPQDVHITIPIPTVPGAGVGGDSTDAIKREMLHLMGSADILIHYATGGEITAKSLTAAINQKDLDLVLSRTSLRELLLLFHGKGPFNIAVV